MRGIVLACLLLSLSPLHAQLLSQSLAASWEFSRGGTDIWYPAVVPGTVHADLLRNGFIPDPYIGDNVDRVQWVEKEDWVYRCRFTVQDELLQREQVELVFKGLDTFADVRVNGNAVGSAENMFRTWAWPVRPLLRPGVNEVTVHFHSPLRIGAERRTAYGIQLPHDSDSSGVSPYIRKAAYQFGWDFCPRLVTSGIWQHVELQAWNDGRISKVSMQRPKLEGASKVMRRQVLVHVEGAEGAQVHVAVDGRNAAVGPVRNGVAVLQVPVGSERWWPNGSGGRRMYGLQVELREKGRVLDRVERRIGLVDVRLVQEQDSIGRSFLFRVNGRDIFMKGCNLVPPHMLLPTAGDSAWVGLVGRMQQAGMNMVRVWAGGVYPPDAFFTACDTAGILVWQDLMFAQMVPGDEGMRANIRQEVSDLVARIDHHPSVALYCGNNELDVAWHNWGWQQRYGLHGTDSLRVWTDHRELFDTVLPPLLTKPYTPTSALSNWGNEAGLRSGDLHYWGVWHADSTIASYRNNVGRFMSEWGFQSYPDSALLARFIPPDSLFLGSGMVERLQRSYRTDGPIWHAIEDLTGARPETFGEFVEASQWVQAQAYSLAVQAHLDRQPACRGTLLWQLNDCWPGPSWSIIDHLGYPKPAYSAVREVFLRRK
jgi:beta-mannosidase